MSSHEHAGPALLGRALAPQPVNLPVVVDLVVLQHSQLDLAVLVLDLLGCGVILLLAFLCTAPEPQHQVQGALLLYVVVAQGTPVFQLLPSKDQSLLVWRNSLLVLNPPYFRHKICCNHRKDPISTHVARKVPVYATLPEF